eukprot:gene12945-27314_t
MELEHLVLDSGAIIKGQSNLFYKTAKNIWTVEGVLTEIRDSKSRIALENLPYEIKLKAPSLQALKAVVEFSKKSGDYPSLSKTDISVIALTYTLECEYSGSQNIRKEPVAQLKELLRLSAQKKKKETPPTAVTSSEADNWPSESTPVSSLEPCCCSNDSSHVHEQPGVSVVSVEQSIHMTNDDPVHPVSTGN